MQSLIITFRYTFGLLWKVIINILLYPFSRLARNKLSYAYQALSYSFYGHHHVELSSLLTNEDLRITLEPIKARRHNTTEFELLSLCSILKDKKCNIVFEIGTFDGRTTRALALNLNDSNGKVYTLNLPPQTQEVSLDTNQIDINLASKVVSGERFLNTSEATVIEQLWGDSATFDFSSYYSKMDLVFIDGAHSEFYAKNDTAIALKLLKPAGGWILWHDAPYYGVVKFLTAWIKENKFPVYTIKGTSLALAFVKNGVVRKYPQ